VTPSKLVVIGTGGLGRETLWALRAPEAGKPGRSREVLGFLTCREDQHGTEVCGLPVLGSESWVIGRQDVAAVCCVGDPRGRLRLVEWLGGEGVSFATAVHPTASMSEYVEIGAGSIVGAGAVLTSQVSVGRNAVIGAGAIVSHDCRLEDFATLAPGVLLAGSVRVEYGAELGVGASVRPEQIIGRGALVGAGSAVVDAVEANTVVAGVPARPMKRFPADQQL
jgi:sugar O-acyltransferase (sialic acid O-acetyltransferase NeuD family)